MLKADLDHPNFVVENFIRSCCSAYGAVRSIKIHRTAKPFVLVEMATHAQTAELAVAFEGTNFGAHALIHLQAVHLGPLAAIAVAA